MATQNAKIIFSTEIIIQLDKRLVAKGITTNKYEPDPQGESVKILNPGAITINNYTNGQLINTEYPEDTAVVVNLDQQKYFSILVDKVVNVTTSPDLLQVYSERAAVKINEAVDAYILTQIANGAGAISDLNATAITKDNIEDVIFQPALDFLEQNNVPEENRYIVLPYWARSMLYKLDLDKTNQGLENTRFAGRAYGMDVYISNNLPAGSLQGHKVLVGARDLTYFAYVIEDFKIVKNENHTQYFGDVVQGLFKYGAKVINNAGMIVFDNVHK